MNIVLFDAGEIGCPLPLSDVRAGHILNVLHKQVGDTFEAGIENGAAGAAVITAITAEGISFRFEASGSGTPLYPLRLIIGFPRPIQLKRIFRDAAGLGAAEICLCGSDLGEKSYMQTSLVRDGGAYRLLRDGSVQAKSTHIPVLSVYRSLDSCLDEISGGMGHMPVLAALDNATPDIALNAYLSSFTQEHLQTSGVWAAVGSERGWTDRERGVLKSAGFRLCGMGRRILRTESAVTVSAALVLSAMGVL